MALTKEDKKDVSNKFGKALANKVEKATKDKLKPYTKADFKRDNPVSGDYEGRKNTHKLLDSPKSQALAKKAGKPSDADMERSIKANAKRIASNPNHPVMRMEEAHRKAQRYD